MEQEQTELESGERRLLTFALGAEWYGLDISLIRGIEPEPPFTPIPGVPDFILGVFNLRGNLVAALDVRAFLGLPARAADRPGYVVVAEAGGILAGVHVDDVFEVVGIPASAVEPPLSTIERTRAEFLEGSVRVGTAERLVGLLNLSSLLQAAVQE